MAYCDKGFYTKKHSELLGKTYNRLTILGIWKDTERGYYMCKCRCVCGNEKNFRLSYVKTGDIKSCGCAKYQYRKPPENQKNIFDGRSLHPLHKVWNAMLERCENPNCKMFSIYGGRGISVCSEWHDFWQFVKWSDSVGGKPDGFSLDRIDVNGNYCPENCRWANNETQQNNKTTNKYLTYKGETHTVAEWCRLLNLSRYAVQYRISHGWPVDDAFEIPLNHRKDEYKRVIVQKDNSGKIIAQYRSLEELPAEYKVTSVSSACNGTYRRATYKGYIWEYAEG